MMVRFSSKFAREQAEMGGLVGALMLYMVAFCIFSVMFILGEWPQEGVRALTLSALTGAACNALQLMNK